MTIPGSIHNPLREFIYVECAGSASDFMAIFDQIGQCASKRGDRIPTGGMITENVVLTVPGGFRVFGISYKGDIAGWREAVIETAKTLQLRTATIGGSALLTNDGASWPLADCLVDSYEPVSPC
jgi:hypothetical protein